MRTHYYISMTTFYKQIIVSKVLNCSARKAQFLLASYSVRNKAYVDQNRENKGMITVQYRRVLESVLDSEDYDQLPQSVRTDYQHVYYAIKIHLRRQSQFDSQW
ncbi:hypothetical protein BDC45DRAFT_541090 [Circinella umbellata]|nr:hypothetical protein BDC45DRAFT_541090 [Circinella umbellata]